MMRAAILSLLLTWPTTVRGQSSASAPGETLSLDQAIELALQHNRLIRNDQLEVDKAAEGVEIARLRRLPKFEFDFLGLQALTPIEFRFDRGSLGVIPGVGPFPVTDVKIRSSRAPSAILFARATQPLTQLPRIRLGIKLQEANRELAQNKLASRRRDMINQVKRSYYAVLQTQSALATIEESLKLHRELDRVVGEYVLQKVALTADSLEVKTRLAHDEYEATKLGHALAAQKEQLNLLLGRDVRAEFNARPVTHQVALELDLAAAQRRALEQRAEIKEARLKMKQAEYNRRLKKAEAWPEVSLTVGYFSPLGIEVVPRNVAAAGLTVKWEPFDWGRKKRELTEVHKAIEQADNATREAEAQVLLDVNNRFRKLQEVRALLRLTQAAQQAAQEKLRVATNKFRQEAVLFKDVLLTQAAVAEAHHQHEQALLAFLTARADFEKALGEQ
jgi:outer membrane protein TolC